MVRASGTEPSSAARDLTPSSALPLAYFAVAHAGLAVACGVLVASPGVPGAFFYHPRMVALVHLVTVGWLTGSILGAFYIVAPLALRLTMPVRRGDWLAFAAFVVGVAGMVPHFWIGEYSGMSWSGLLVIAAVFHVGVRAWRGLPTAAVPWPIALHVVLAFGNFIAAAGFGVLLGFDRSRGWLSVTPLEAAWAHAHLAAIGWVVMMVVGLGYRLIPMILPAAMPAGRVLAASAILIESGLMVMFVAFLVTGGGLAIGAALVAAGLVSFGRQIHGTVKRRVPRPPALPRRDWSAWQAHVALLWLLVALVLGLFLSSGAGGSARVVLMWTYGTAGLVGFLAQIVVGMQGRLIPLYAWYRAMAQRSGRPPAVAANALPAESFARAIFLLWFAGVLLLVVGLPVGSPMAIRTAAGLLLAGLAVNAAYIGWMVRRAAGDG